MDLPPRGPSVVHGLKLSRVSILVLPKHLAEVVRSLDLRLSNVFSLESDMSILVLSASLFVFCRIHALKLYGFSFWRALIWPRRTFLALGMTKLK